MSTLHLQKEGVDFHGGRHVALPCFYSCPEWTNLTLALQNTFHVFKLSGRAVEIRLEDEEEEEERVEHFVL